MAGFLPHLSTMVEKLERSVENRVKTALDAGTLTADYALNAWIEKLAYRRLLNRTQLQVQFGEDSAAAPTLDTALVPSYITQ